MSSTYSARKKMKFRCKKGHTWKTLPVTIRRGRWCLICAGKAPHTLEGARMLARQKGGRCLSNHLKNSTEPLLWQCGQGHQWHASSASIKGYKGKTGTWCPTCQRAKNGDKMRLSIEEAQVWAGKKGGQCLSKEYQAVQKQLVWKCKYGHTWRTTFSVIRQGSWCPECGIRSKASSACLRTLKKARKFALRKGGKCLSKNYDHGGQKLLFRCKAGHQWKAKPSAIINGRKTWCRKCSTKRLSIDEMKNLALQFGGECLSTEYNTVHEKLVWRCSEGHTFEKTPFWIKYSKRWCPTCSNSRLRIDIKDFLSLAHSKNGECLIDAPKLLRNVKVEWQCRQGHTWKATYKQAQQDWCTECSAISQKVFIQKAAA